MQMAISQHSKWILAVRRQGFYAAYNHVWLGWVRRAETLFLVDRPLIHSIVQTLWSFPQKLTNRWPRWILQHLLLLIPAKGSPEWLGPPIWDIYSLFCVAPCVIDSQMEKSEGSDCELQTSLAFILAVWIVFQKDPDWPPFPQVLSRRRTLEVIVFSKPEGNDSFCHWRRRQNRRTIYSWSHFSRIAFAQTAWMYSRWALIPFLTNPGGCVPNVCKSAWASFTKQVGLYKCVSEIALISRQKPFQFDTTNF